MPREHSPTPDPQIGVLVRDRAGVVAALGIAAGVLDQAALVSALAQAADRTLFPVQLACGPCLGIAIGQGPTQVAVVRPAGMEATLLDFVAAVPFAFDILEQILSDPYRGITVADHTGTMRYISPVHEKFLGLPHGSGIGRAAEDAIPNSRLRAVVESGKAEIGKPQKLNDGVTRVVSRRPIRKNGRIVGAVGQVMFRDAEALSQMAAEMTQLRSQLEFYRTQLDGLRETRQGMIDLVGESQAIQRLRREIATVAKLDVPVLVLGESGTGKELVARAIHEVGRPGQPMVSLNLAALPSTLIESELFGHAAGAFTGAARQGRAGKFELANDGTLFLDEVGDIPIDVQIKLLRVLEERIVEPLGSHSSRQTTFRLVAATHRDMDAALEEGAFRHDLFYRISGVTLRVPPLRERLEDIPELTSHFVQAFCRRNGLPVPSIESGVTRYLADQAWPGNLRQLRHRVEEALVFSEPELLTLDAFTRNDASRVEALTARREPAPPIQTRPAAAAGPGRLQDHQRAAALRTVQACGGNKKQAAERLGISRSYLYKLLA